MSLCDSGRLNDLSRVPHRLGGGRRLGAAETAVSTLPQASVQKWDSSRECEQLRGKEALLNRLMYNPGKEGITYSVRSARDLEAQLAASFSNASQHCIAIGVRSVGGSRPGAD